jgi:hypothetical protein
MLSSFVGTSLAILIAVVGQSAERPEDPVTPADVVAKCNRAPLTSVVVVKYRVRDVAESNPDWTYLYADELPNRNHFAVELSRAARAALKERAVSDFAKYFTGKEVEFAGRIKVTLLWCFPTCELYTLRVDSLEQIREPRATDRPTGKRPLSCLWIRDLQQSQSILTHDLPLHVGR